MKLVKEVGDMVFDLETNRKGVIKSIYKNLNIAIVKFDDIVEKKSLDSLTVLEIQEEEPRDFLDNIIDWVKKLIHRFKRRGAYDYNSNDN